MIVSACSKSPSRHNPDPGPEKVAIPGAASASSGPGSSDGAATTGNAAPAAAGGGDARFHLRPEEGTLTIEKINGKVGAALVSNIVVTPAAGLHLATDFPIKITLAPTSGVALAKTELTAGGRDKSAGDASVLSEQRLGFAITATAEKAGAYEITGMFKFGVCDKDSCHPKRQPIAISIAAN